MTVFISGTGRAEPIPISVKAGEIEEQCQTQCNH